jgi:hypothetical protein
MLHREIHIENHLQRAQKRLADRLELLTTKGLDAVRINKDAQIKHFKSQVRKARKSLSAIAAVKSLMDENAESRQRKEAAAKMEALNKIPKKRDRNAPPAKKKKKRHMEEENE